MAKAKKWNPKSRIIAAVRKIWLWSPLRREALKRAKTASGLYKCSDCDNEYEKVHVDHIEPVIDVKNGWQGYDSFVERLLFISDSGVQILCETCHSTKTQLESELRKKYTAKRKKHERNIK